MSANCEPSVLSKSQWQGAEKRRIVREFYTLFNPPAANWRLPVPKCTFNYQRMRLSCRMNTYNR